MMPMMKDLHKFFAKIFESSQIFDMRRVDVDKLIQHFYNALKSIGDSLINDHKWIIKSKYKSSSLRKKLSDRFVDKVLVALDGLIKRMQERFKNDEKEKNDSSSPSKASNIRLESVVEQPIRPRTVLNQPSKETKSNNGDGDDESVEEKESETERIETMEKAKDSVKKETDDKNCSKAENVPKSLVPTLPPLGNVAVKPPQPLPMAAGNRPGAPPPPPPGLGAKKATTKLKRSAHLGGLYRFLTTVMEGKDPAANSRGAGRGNRGGIGSVSASGKQGMADALAEITKKSAYFQDIEKDVQMYMKAINELKTEISKFQSKDMTSLEKFHCYVESVLDNLKNETQVLARCEGFPQSKLEAIRTAAALSSKLQNIMKELKNWKVESPANQLFDKTERYFEKIRKEIETLDQIKEEEEKKFKSHNIHFDFNMIIKIKELMVDVSSGCMELVLKEKREAKIASHTAESRGPKPSMINSKTAKMLWRAFQFAYRVYIFAGGHDDRADKLTRELGDEIKLILGY